MLVFGLLKTFLFLQCCEWCATIRVPNYWDDHGSTGQFNSNSDFQNSELNNPLYQNNDFDVGSFEPINQNYKSEPITSIKPISLEYFEYPVKKPHFAVQVAAFHGVKSPQSYYKAYPIKPQTGLRKPVFGKHYIKEQDQLSFKPLKYYFNNKEQYKVKPVSSNYEIYHPYKEEEPALKQLYKDPVLLKIRNDIHDNKKRLQNYEIDTEKSDVSKDDYLKNPDDIDKDKFPIKNDPTKYEIYKPQRRPIYYKPLQKFSRNQYLNRKFKHPLYQNYIKVRPNSYRPLQKHLHKLRDAHVQKYDDEHNEYPQIRPVDLEEISEGIDIYEKGKEKYLQLRNNADNAINQAVLDNRPTTYENLELQKSDESEYDESNEDEEFVPVKSYAQVRKTETSKYLPREAALQEASNYEEIENAPRLREAVKSTKSQTVYSEEGYEDTAYDHAGEQKHASDLEGHAGYLKENENSKGKFKAPVVNGKYSDGYGSKYGDEIAHGEKWQNNDKETQNESDDESSHDDEYDESIEDEIYQSVPIPEKSKRDKRSDSEIDNLTNINEHRIPNNYFRIPELNLNNTYLTEQEIIKISKQKKSMPKKFNVIKYPYYKSMLKLNKHSPLRYAENLKLIPKKTRGGTEFYDSRSSYQCAEVDEDLDPIPKNVKDAEKNKGDDDNSNNKRKKRETDVDVVKEKPRLKDLGDKIDCFKAKYFGENPLDSPFFKEEIISSPEPIYFPNIASYNLDQTDHLSAQSSMSNTAFSIAEKLREENKKDIYDLIEKLKNDSFGIQRPIKELNKNKDNNTKNYNFINSNIFEVFKNSNKTQPSTTHINDNSSYHSTIPNKIVTNKSIFETESNGNKTNELRSIRKKRNSRFVYEPYKVIRDNPGFDSKKTTTLTNISPLIKQLQSSKLVELIPHSNDFKKSNNLQPKKRNANYKQYKNITRIDRKTKTPEPSPIIEDINNDKRKGEPRYEITYHNHKNTYTPVENKTSVTMDDYESIKPQKQSEFKKSKHYIKQQNSEESIVKSQTPRPFFDVSQYLPKNDQLNRPPPPRYIPKRRIITSSSTEEPYTENASDIEEYDYDDEKDVTTETNQKSFVNNKSVYTTSIIPDSTTAHPKLKLVTKFRKSVGDDISLDDESVSNPQFTEKSKKSSKSTLVTDSKKYGEGDDNMKKEEIDQMIGIQQDMGEYMPEYEKVEAVKVLNNDDDREDEDINFEEDDSDEETDYEDIDDEEEYDDEDSSSDEEDDIENIQQNKQMVVDNDDKEIEIKSENKIKPIVLKKKIEIHKEDPVNESSPHIIKFKEDIIEEEVIKKLPKKNTEALELYKDEGLAKKVNNLADVEIFKEDLRKSHSPKHGGNYRRLNEKLNSNIEKIDESDGVNKNNEDTEISQSENTKVTDDLTDETFIQTPKVRHSQVNSRGKMRHKNVVTPLPQIIVEQPQVHNQNKNPNNPVFVPRVRGQRQRSAKITLNKNENINNRGHMHNGKIKINNIKSKQNAETKAEIDETIIPPNIMHGGNLKSLSETSRDPRRTAADLLNSFAQAVPILTTTPAYILDPSKRMYYYVDV